LQLLTADEVAAGGVGFSTREHGLLLDAIVQLDYVLANGACDTNG
jgi:hypothetical protein